jgi:uncharacterized membrane protein
MFSLTQNYITRGFWGDEAWTSLISQLPYTQMLKTTAADFHPPGYYTVVELFYKFLPATEVATRSISFIFYILTGFLVWKLASEIKGKVFGLLSAIVVLLNPIFFTYAFEARNYTMFAFAATGSIYFLVKLSERFDLRRAIGFILFSALGIYTHYYMFFILAAQGFYLIISDRKFLFKMIGVYIAVVILYLPWIPFLLGQLTSVSESYWIGGIGNRTHYEAILRILGGEHQNAFRPWLFGLSLILVGAGLMQHIRRKSFEKPYILIWLWAVVPFILATLPGLKVGEFQLPFRPIFFWRYLIGASVPVAMVIVHASQKLPGPIFKISIFLIITMSIVIDYGTFTRYPNTFKQIYDQDIIGNIKADDKIVTVLPSFAEVLYYKERNGLINDVIILPEGLVQFSGKSLLDAYVANGTVEIGEAPDTNYFELTPGPKINYSTIKK